MYAQIFLLTILSASQCLEFSAASKTICRCLWTQKLQTRCNKKKLLFSKVLIQDQTYTWQHKENEQKISKLRGKISIYNVERVTN